DRIARVCQPPSRACRGKQAPAYSRGQRNPDHAPAERFGKRPHLRADKIESFEDNAGEKNSCNRWNCDQYCDTPSPKDFYEAAGFRGHWATRNHALGEIGEQPISEANERYAPPEKE